MKKVLSIILIVIFMMAMASVAYADEFVESVGAEDTPKIVEAIIKDAETGEVLEEVPAGHLVVTSVAKAPTSTEIPEAAREELLMVYEKLTDGSMVLPAEKIDADLKASDLAIRDLFDVSWICEYTCHAEMIEPENIVLEVVFETEIEADVTVHTMSYNDGEWNPIVKTVNNGDGTLTCTFEHLCPVVFAVDTRNATTGDPMGNQMYLWIAVLAASAAGLVGMVVVRRKNKSAK